jgi:hypothetical protein
MRYYLCTRCSYERGKRDWTVATLPTARLRVLKEHGWASKTYCIQLQLDPQEENGFSFPGARLLPRESSSATPSSSTAG